MRRGQSLIGMTARFFVAVMFAPLLYAMFIPFALTMRIYGWVSDDMIDRFTVLGVTARIQNPRASFDPYRLWWKFQKGADDVSPKFYSRPR